MSNPKTVVIFRRWSKKEGGGVLAIFPNDLGTDDPYTCDSYDHRGQHASCDPVLAIAATKPVKLTDEDVQALKRELESYGPLEAHYNLVVRKKCSPKYLINRQAELARQRREFNERMTK